MPSKRRTSYLPLLLVAVVVVLLNTWFAVASVRSLRLSEYWLAHTWQVVGQVERVLSSASEGESGARGFLITGNDRFLTQFYVGRHEIAVGLQQFEVLTADNPRQRVLAAEMRDAATQRFAVLDHNIQTRRNDGTEAAAAEVATLTGALQMERVRTAGLAMEDEERRLLEIREDDVHRNATVALVAIGLASGLDLVLLVLVGRYLARERNLRLRTEETNEQLALANAEVARNTGEIHKLNQELELRVRERTAELESTNRELEAFSYSVSHDLRAPLRTIDGFSLALEEDYAEAIDDTGRDYIRRVRAGVQRMGGLIDALLQLSRITRAELTRQDVNVTALVESVTRDLHEAHPEQVMQFDIEPGMTAFADPDLLRVAFENLLGNAVKFSSKVPVSIISVTQDLASRRFTISDNGAGFDMHYSAKLFNAFNRLHGDKDFKGSGIGLATVARVVSRHHGTISANSELGHGATFTFTLG